MISSIKAKIKKLFRRSTKSQIDILVEKGLKIGTNNIIHSPDCFDAVYPWLIEVGSNNLFSTNIKIIAHDSSTCYVCGYAKVGRVSIGNNVYLGYGTTILCNVTIGDNVIVGANTLVNRDLPSNGVYAGNPVRYICSVDEYRQKHTKQLDICPVYEQSWRYWANQASNDHRQQMKDELANGVCGYVK